MIALAELGPEQAAELSLFSRLACEYDPLSATSIRRAIFDDPDPQVVGGVYGTELDAVGVGVVRGGDRGCVKLLAVHPRMRGRMLGRRLLETLEAWLREHGAASVEVGAAPPWYVAPGVDPRYTAGVLLLEEAGYERIGEAVNLGVPLRTLPEPSLEVRPAVPDDVVWIEPWLREIQPVWVEEVERAAGRGTCVVLEPDGFCCWDVTRDGWVGPLATRPDARGRGVGASTLLGALRAMREGGRDRAEIAWAGPLKFYARACGATVSRVFWRYRKTL